MSQKEEAHMNPQFDGSFVLSLIMAIAASIATYVNLRLKSDVQQLKAEFEKSNYALESRISGKLDEFRREFSSGFVPNLVEVERRNATTQALTRIESEVAQNRTRIHDISNQVMSTITSKIFEMFTQITDKARRLASVEARLDALERSFQSLEREHHELDSEVRDHR